MRNRPLLPILLTALMVAAGCATPGPTQLSHARVLAPDQEDNLGGSFIESADIRTVASQMCPAILAVPEITSMGGTTQIAIHPIRNSTRYVFDKDIFMKLLRIELNRYSGGMVRFIDPRAAGSTTMQVVRERDEDDWDETIETAADHIVSSPLVQMSDKPIRMSVLEFKNVNLADMNAMSFAALLRAKIAEKSYQKVTFVNSLEGVEGIAREGLAEADYYLGGEFIAQSIKEEGLDTAGVYLVTQDSVSISSHSSTHDEGSSVQAQATKIQTTEITPILEVKSTPNVAKYLNIMVIDAKSGETVIEKLVKLERKAKSGLGAADFVLTGEVSAFSKASGGDRSDYVIISFQLIEPETNAVIWEDAYETKKVTNRSVVYK